LAALVIGVAAAAVGALNAAIGFASPGVSVVLAALVVLSPLWVLGAFVAKSYGAGPRETETVDPGVQVTYQRDFPGAQSGAPQTPAPSGGQEAPRWRRTKKIFVAVNVGVLFLAGLVAVVSGCIDFVTKVV
jgi:hypothetical protein